MSAPRLASPRIRDIDMMQPLSWLASGWKDFLRCPGVGLLHGLAVTVFGGVLLWLAHGQFWFLAGAFSGFLLVAPLAATGLYAISRALARGQTADRSTAMAVWLSFDRRMIAFGLLLWLAGTGWVACSAALITLLSPTPINEPADFVRHVLLNRHSALFELWTLLGGFLAAPVFASSVVALPLLLDRPDVGVLQAVLTSWQAVLTNPMTMAVWALLLVVLSLLGMAALLAGLALVVPLLGHASWHAYRALVDHS